MLWAVSLSCSMLEPKTMFPKDINRKTEVNGDFVALSRLRWCLFRALGWTLWKLKAPSRVKHASYLPRILCRNSSSTHNYEYPFCKVHPPKTINSTCSCLNAIDSHEVLSIGIFPITMRYRVNLSMLSFHSCNYGIPVCLWLCVSSASCIHKCQV